jgi:predicted TIM-barrel fold metal-dependent hydrolase
MTALDYPAFDADNHYYEALDAFTRHLDPKLGPRTVQWAEIDGRMYHVVGGRVSRAVSNATFDPIAKPGSLCDFLRGRGDGRSALELLRDREPIPAVYRDREARVKRLVEQGLEAIWLFPTLGVLYEEQLKHDPQAVTWTFRAFNRWLDEDWGFAHQDKIFAAPYLPLCDVGFAVEELEWALDRGARVVCVRPAAVFTHDGPKSPADPVFDPFWARVAEAGVTTVIHAGDSGYSCNGYVPESFSASFGEGQGMRPSIKSWSIERAAHDFLATLIFDRLFERFPRLRVASIENGSDFLPDLLRKLRSMGRKAQGWFQEDPVETFRRHVWINPFWEDDVHEILDLMGPDRVLFGSDWPHIEGMPEPLDYLAELESLPADTVRRIMRENVLELNAPPA